MLIKCIGRLKGKVLLKDGKESEFLPVYTGNPGSSSFYSTSPYYYRHTIVDLSFLSEIKRK